MRVIIPLQSPHRKTPNACSGLHLECSRAQKLIFYGALAHAASCVTASPESTQSHLEALRSHGKLIDTWAEYCPDNFENRAVLVAAEIARIEGRVIDAEELYEKAIQSAQEYGFVQNEAIANELAAQFYRARGLKTIARAYLRNACACYRQWGAMGKVAQLEASFPELKSESLIPPADLKIAAPVSQMDTDIVLEASRTLSSEINLSTLIEKLIRLGWNMPEHSADCLSSCTGMCRSSRARQNLRVAMWRPQSVMSERKRAICF